MKSAFYLILIFLMSATCLLAQTPAASRWTIGVKGGLGKTGLNKTEQIDLEIADHYSTGMSFAAGVRFGYRISDHFAVTADAEWQYLRDKRVRDFSVTGLADGPLTYTSVFNNSFNRFQVPIQLQIYPIPKITKAYILAGLMPTFISGGKFKYGVASSRTGMVSSGEVPANFDYPGNAEQRKDLVLLTGLGIPITKRISVELIYHFNKPMQCATVDPDFTFIGIPFYSSKANQGFMLSVIAKLK